MVERRLTRRQQQRWLEQWRVASRELPKLRCRELRSLSQSQLLARIDALLTLAAEPAFQNPRRKATSGLVEQQRWFRKIHRP